MTTGAFLAHGGGAPQAATVIVPLLLVGVFVYVERRNMRRQAQEQEREAGPDGS